MNELEIKHTSLRKTAEPRTGRLLDAMKSGAGWSSNAGGLTESHWTVTVSSLPDGSAQTILKPVDKVSAVVSPGDVVAFSTGSSNAPFKYWKPSVSSSGVLSWTNSTSTSTPSSVNIKGPKGDKGDRPTCFTSRGLPPATSGAKARWCKARMSG